MTLCTVLTNPLHIYTQNETFKVSAYIQYNFPLFGDFFSDYLEHIWRTPSLSKILFYHSGLFFGLSKRIYSDVLFSFIPGRGCLPHKEFLNQIKQEKLMHAFQLIAECNGPFYKDCHLQT